MKTLYDLLGALPDDDAEDLRAAFRTAVKGVHPDIHPNDPDAATKFRLIVRANEILRDSDQRLAYDHLLEIARQEQEAASRNALAAKLYKLAFGVVALAGASVASTATYVLLTQISTASIPNVQIDEMDTLARGSAEIAAITLASPWDLNDRPDFNDRADFSDRADFGVTVGSRAGPLEGTLAEAISEQAITAKIPPPPSAPNRDIEPFEALRDRGIAAYRSGDFEGAIARLDQAIQINPHYKAAYIDRGIVFYRMRKFDRAFADIAKAKRLERTKIESVVARKSRSSQSGSAIRISQLSQARIAKDISRSQGNAFARMP